MLPLSFAFSRRFILLLLLAAGARAGQVCDLTFTACPSQLPKGTWAVPPEVISLDVRVPACQESGKITSGASPSIMFIIDHSGSMNQTDPDNARYTVVNSLLDSIHAATPGARVGLSIFSHRLAFDYRDNTFFRALFPGDAGQHDSYVPLTRLDSLFAGGKRGVDTLKALLKLTAGGELLYHTTRPKERTPNGGGGSGRGGTDITLGFDAALAAFKASPGPKESQFIIFLSDGEPSVSDDLRIARSNAYEAGLNTPATYTVFFNPEDDTPPETITRMTENIRASGYSTANPNSAVYTINLPGAELKSILQRSVLSRILVVPATGKSVTLSIVGGTSQTTASKGDSSTFLLAARMPLNAVLTPIEMKYTHSFLDTSVVPPLARDTLFTYAFTVQRSAGAVLPPYTVKTCRDQAELSLLAGGQAITTVTADHAALEPRLTLPPGQACDNCSVKVGTTSGGDRESIHLTPAGIAALGPFRRLESLTPTALDYQLQHLPGDSIILVWTNPENALDMVRKSYPYIPIAPTLVLYAGGKALDTVTSAHPLLEVRLILPSGEPCSGCTVEITTSFGTDKEPVRMDGTASPYRGSFRREVSLLPVPGDAVLQHPASDSIVAVYRNPLNPSQYARRSWPFVNFANAILLQPHNDVARVPRGISNAPGEDRSWVLADAPGLMVQVHQGACCKVLAAPAGKGSPDSARLVGMVVEATREFQVDLWVYSNLGQFVDKVGFTVPKSEFAKLTPVPGKEARFVRLLWNGRTFEGSRAGSGAYILKTVVKLLPIPGIAGAPEPATNTRTVGILRDPG